uniref:CRIB domain-containing protein n=1 Tax=Salvator merianae TaxID=96440 RepID=A0A8D0B083_SALMN
MPAKMPIYLKTSTPKRGRKLHLRDVLSSDMISPPLGDFRHSAHIGLDGEGDMFGELSFLQGRHELLPRLGRCGGGSSGTAELFGRCPTGGGGYRTLLKSAISLPAFSGAQDQPPPKPPRLHLEELPGGPQQPRSMSVSGTEGLPFATGCSCPHVGRLPPRSESLLHLDLDLGPSILDDVLRIMEEYQQPGDELEFPC